MSDTYECRRHGEPVRIIEKPASCLDCVAEWTGRKDAKLMTPEERAAELESWLGILTIQFDQLHQRIEELVGRPVWTHELASPEKLAAEIRSQKPATAQDVLDKIPKHHTVHLVEVVPVSEKAE